VPTAGPIRAVVDPGVFVSGLINPSGTPGRIVAAWRAGEAELIVSATLLHELGDVLGRPEFRRYFPEDRAAGFTEELQAGASHAGEGLVLPLSPDPKDDYLLALARSSGADYLVSGNRRHLFGLGLDKYPPVVSPRDFLEILEGRRAGRD
jgi:putative PIN family toxin of toxin-antitoxin system